MHAISSAPCQEVAENQAALDKATAIRQKQPLGRASMLVSFQYVCCNQFLSMARSSLWMYFAPEISGSIQYAGNKDLEIAGDFSGKFSLAQDQAPDGHTG